MLGDYPEHIERLREILDEFSERKPRLQPFDEAIWALQSRLGAFIQEARDELKRAEAGGDATEIAKAEAKLSLMFSAHSGNIGLSGRSLEGLWRYFESNKDAFE
ncbi:hypothetical protein J5226_19595 [Lysobacter sp. K5869]|nr:hypothetical protein J5226_19595 [Lysobacter sp. K5869]